MDAEFRGGLLRRWRLVALLVALAVIFVASLLIAPIGRLLAVS